MAEAIGGEGEVGIVGHSQTNATGVERRDGFVEYMEENHPDVEIVDIQYGDGDHLQSADIAKAMIGAHDLIGLYGTHEGSPIAIGRLTVEAAIAVVNGESVEEFTDTGSYWYDAENIDDEDIQEMLYE